MSANATNPSCIFLFLRLHIEYFYFGLPYCCTKIPNWWPRGRVFARLSNTCRSSVGTLIE